MATYKVIQDIEAEDKLFGPLTFKQMAFGLGGVFFAWLNFFAVAKGFPVAMIIFTPPMLLGFFLAIPWSKDQPTEVWVLAKLRFRLKPKKRIWSQSGMEELVTITVPKKIEKVLTNNLSQVEVRSRLETLAKTIDSRGWAVKHAELDQALQVDTADRLVSPATLPQEVPIIDLNSIPDVMDAGTPTYNNLDRMMQQSADTRMQQNMDKLDRVRSGEPLEALQQPEVHFTPPTLPSSDPSSDEAALSAQLKSRKLPDVGNSHSHLKTIQPFNPYAVEPATQEPGNSNQELESSEPDGQVPNSQFPITNLEAQASIPSPDNPAILPYVDNNDLDVATIARRVKKDTEDNGGEVVISLR